MFLLKLLAISSPLLWIVGAVYIWLDVEKEYLSEISSLTGWWTDYLTYIATSLAFNGSLLVVLFCRIYYNLAVVILAVVAVTMIVGLGCVLASNKLFLERIAREVEEHKRLHG